MKLITIIIFCLFSFSCTATEPTTEKSDCMVLMNGLGMEFYKLFALETDGSFYSWLQDRPETIGKWQFARYYNGKYYKRNNYDQKLAHAYNKLISNKKP